MFTILLQTALVHFASGLRDSVQGITCFKAAGDDNDALHKRSRKTQGQSVLAARRGEPAKVDRTPQSTKAVNTMIQCTLWNGGLCGLSLLFFWMVMLPILEYAATLSGLSAARHVTFWSWIQTVASYAFHALWLIPMTLLGKIVNSIWFQDLADVAWLMVPRNQRRSRLLAPPMSMFLADIVFSLLAEVFFLIQGEVLLHLQDLFPASIPAGRLLGPLNWLHTSLLYSMYAFEYKWYYEGTGVKARMNMVESQWLYYFGFGLPLTLLTSYPESYFTRCVLFSLGFPWLILAAFCADEKALNLLLLVNMSLDMDEAMGPCFALNQSVLAGLVIADGHLGVLYFMHFASLGYLLGFRVRFFAAAYWLTNKTFAIIFRRSSKQSVTPASRKPH